MSKIYKNVSGTWRPVKAVYDKVSTSWLRIKKVLKNVSGTWRVVHQDEVTYTFTTNVTATASTGILLSNYVSPSSADVINVVINSGVTLSGMTGTTGTAGAGGSSSKVTNCYSTNIGNGVNGGVGGVGGTLFDLSGFSGKTVNIINNGILKTGKGGIGGTGGGYLSASCDSLSSHYSGCGGAGGNTGASYSNSSGVTVSVSGTAIASGGVGDTGGRVTGNRGGYSYSAPSCDCDHNME